jgi:hypothetical protein
MSENTFEAVDVSDFTYYCRGVHVCWIQYTQPGRSVILVAFLEISLRAAWMGNTLSSYGAASFLNAVAGIALSLIGTSIVLPVRLSVTLHQQNILRNLRQDPVPGCLGYTQTITCKTTNKRTT